MNFLGFFALGGTLSGLFQATGSNGLPAAADALPTFRIYGPGGLMSNGTGTCSAFDASNVTGLYKFTVPLNGGDGYARGGTYTVRVLATVSAAAQVGMFSFVVA